MKGAEFRTVPENLSDWGMHCCVLHCLNFPVNGFSVRRSCRKTGHQRKGSVPEPYGVCCWCVLQMGFWRTWCHVREGRMREICGSRLWQQTLMKPGHHIKHGTIPWSNSQAVYGFCNEAESENHQTEEWTDIPNWELPKKPALQRQCLKISPALRGSHQYCSSV